MVSKFRQWPQSLIIKGFADQNPVQKIGVGGGGGEGGMTIGEGRRLIQWEGPESANQLITMQMHA